MYVPKQFNQPAHAAAIMREHPFASVVTTYDTGFPFMTYLPLKLAEEENGQPTLLLGHCAHSSVSEFPLLIKNHALVLETKPGANPLGGYLKQRPLALVSFMGPHAYMSPKVYGEEKQRVPTWSYLAVQARVEVRLLEGDGAKDAVLKGLIADHEPAYAEQWRGLPEAVGVMWALEYGLEKNHSVDYFSNRHYTFCQYFVFIWAAGEIMSIPLADPCDLIIGTGPAKISRSPPTCGARESIDQEIRQSLFALCQAEKVNPFDTTALPLWIRQQLDEKWYRYEEPIINLVRKIVDRALLDVTSVLDMHQKNHGVEAVNQFRWTDVTWHLCQAKNAAEAAITEAQRPMK